MCTVNVPAFVNRPIPGIYPPSLIRDGGGYNGTERGEQLSVFAKYKILAVPCDFTHASPISVEIQG